MAKYPILTDEMFREMMQSDKGIREARYATGYGRWVDGKSVTDGHYVNWPDGYGAKCEISEEQMAEAKRMFEKRHDEVFADVSRKGVLCFHAMGMDYKPNVAGGIGNYRIRSTFKDKTGHVWFVELHPNRNSRGYADEKRGCWGEVYDVSRNEAEKKAYEDDCKKMLETYGSWHKTPSNLRPTAPWTHYENVGVSGPFTYGRLLEWINERYGCGYKEIKLERFFLDCDETISEC